MTVPVRASDYDLPDCPRHAAVKLLTLALQLTTVRNGVVATKARLLRPLLVRLCPSTIARRNASARPATEIYSLNIPITFSPSLRTSVFASGGFPKTRLR